MSRYQVEPQRDLNRDDDLHDPDGETSFVKCDEAEAELFAVIDTFAGELVDDEPTRAEAEALIAKLEQRIQS